jgi:predicted cupin superfamily sugar epimerase
MPDPSADDLICRLGLAPHPEGGWYRETFRDRRLDPNGRAHATAIYFLLKAHETSHWHKVDAAEIWLFHAGAPLELSVAADGSEIVIQRLGNAVALGEQPQAVVPAGAWQSARSLGDWTLVSCVVAPGFEFSGFQLAPPDWSPSRGMKRRG